MVTSGPPPRSKGSFVISHVLVDSRVLSQVSPSAWAVYTCLLRHADVAGYCYPTEARLCYLTGLGRTTVSQSVRILVKTELITVKKETAGKRKHPRNHYHLLSVIPTKESEKGYVRVQRELIDACIIDRVGPSAWAVYICILRHSDAQGRCFPSMDRLGSLAGVTRNTVSNCVKRLQDVGLILVRRERTSGAPYPHNAYLIGSQTAVAAHLRAEAASPIGPKSERTVVQNLHSKYAHPSLSGGQKNPSSTRQRGAADLRQVAHLSVETEINSGAAMVVPPRGVESGVMGTREEHIVMQLCLHLGGHDVVTSLLDTPTHDGGLSRRRWLTLSPKAVDRAAREAENDAGGDIQKRIARITALLDQQITRKGKKKPA